MSMQPGSIDADGLARTTDGKLYVTAVGTAAITGGNAALDTLSLNSLGAITSGTYTPTLSNDANVTSSTALSCQYIRVGNVVHVSGGVTFQPTSASVTTRVGISLPIASNLINFNDLGGAAATAGFASGSASVYGNTASDRASLEYINGTDVASRNWTFTFSYRVQ